MARAAAKAKSKTMVVGLRMDRSLVQWLDRKCADEDRSRASFISRLLQREMAQEPEKPTKRLRRACSRARNKPRPAAPPEPHRHQLAHLATLGRIQTEPALPRLKRAK